jgi:hypothetical protein
MVEACVPAGASNICAYGTAEKRKCAAGMAAGSGALNEMVSSLNQMFAEKPGAAPEYVPVGETPPTTGSIA